MEGVMMACEWCQDPILIETDSAEIIRMLESKKRDISELGNLITEAKFLLGSDRIAGIAKVPRSQNKASHELARFGSLNSHTAVWLGFGAETILDALSRDCNDTMI
jgi:hypothetical protein